jgi:hypothetical protein
MTSVVSDEIPIIIIGGKKYYHDTSSNGLYSIQANGGLGHWVGFYEPLNKANPIHYTVHPGGGARRKRYLRNKRATKRKNIQCKYNKIHSRKR